MAISDPDANPDTISNNTASTAETIAPAVGTKNCTWSNELNKSNGIKILFFR